MAPAACGPDGTPTASPTATPTGVPTNTPVPTSTPIPPTATPTATPQATDTPIPTVTSRPRVTATATPCHSNIPVGNLQTVDCNQDWVSWDIANKTGSAITLTSVSLTWPWSANKFGTWNEAALGGKTFWTGKAWPSPYTLNSGWVSGVSRSINNAQTKSLKLDICKDSTVMSTTITLDNLEFDLGDGKVCSFTLEP